MVYWAYNRECHLVPIDLNQNCHEHTRAKLKMGLKKMGLLSDGCKGRLVLNGFQDLYIKPYKHFIFTQCLYIL